jgi:hypothetical protein
MIKKISIEQADKFIANDFSKMSKEEVNAINKTELDKMEAQHRKFIDAFQAGNCYLCDEDLGSVKEDQPCIHWLLRKNKRFKKKYIFFI